MDIRKAQEKDFDMIMKIYEDAIDKMNIEKIFQWDETYPNSILIMDDIIQNQMYVLEDENQILSVFVLNRQHDIGYDLGEWKYRNIQYVVLHRLCVNSTYQSKGLGVKTVIEIEKLLKNEKVEVIRLDAYSKNPYAIKLYEKLHYEKVGEVNFRKGLFYLYEKKI